MVSSSWKAVALRWNIFFLISSIIAFEEYSPLYMKQLGLSASEVGLTTLMGIPLLFIPLIGYLGDRFRARKLVLLTAISILIILSLTPLLSPLFMARKCKATSNIFLINETKTTCNRTVCLNTLLDELTKTPGKKPQSVGLNETASILERNAYSLSSLSLFLFIILTRGVYEMIKSAAISLSNVATMTFIRTERASYGSYYCWGQIGASFSLFAIGMISSHITNSICGRIEHGYFVTYPWTAFTMSMSLFALPWINYEYLKHRAINWDDVKNVCETHYLVVLFIGFYFGWCISFQQYWEYWYIYELSGSPVVMGIGGLIRRPFVAMWFLLSGKVIERLGDLQTMTAALFLFAASQFTLSIIEIPWLVLVVDVFQSAAFGFSYSALTVHFSKAGSKASSAVVLGLADFAYAFGQESGSTAMGLLFGYIGSRGTLFYYSIATTFILILFMGYILGVKHLDDYEQACDSNSEDSE